MLGKVTARNYAAQAVAGLRDTADRRLNHSAMDQKRTRTCAELIEKAVHFALPDFGMVLNADLKGLAGVNLRLPYPLVTLEYFVPYKPDMLKERTPTYSAKRIVILEEFTRDQIEVVRAPFVEKDMEFFSALADPKGLDGDNFVFFACACEIRGLWQTMGATWLFPCENWYHGRSADGAHSVAGHVGVMLPDYATQLVKEYGSRRARDTLQIDIEGEMRAAMEFIEAMSCRNITSETHEPGAKQAVNDRRARQGKPPLNETKRLIIDPRWFESHYKGPVQGSADGRASPRQHLRRGHFRRIRWGTPEQEQIWIFPTVVGDPQRGTIEKTYQVGR